jgi:hypothetical protein
MLGLNPYQEPATSAGDVSPVSYTRERRVSTMTILCCNVGSTNAVTCRNAATRERYTNQCAAQARLPSARLLTRVDLADDGVIDDADEGGVERPRPLVADGALVGWVVGCSAW